VPNLGAWIAGARQHRLLPIDAQQRTSEPACPLIEPATKANGGPQSPPAVPDL
jgi:hypothetical protein